ncbi:MAG: helix-turn-helix domain-containing protein [Thermofilum sp.]
MYIGVFDIEQADCPIVKLTEKREGVTTTVLSVNVSELSRGLEQVYLTLRSDEKGSKAALKNVLGAISSLPEVKSYRVLGKLENMWRVHMYISKTHTMESSITLGAMFVSPWVARNGVERWTLGFASKKQLYDFLAKVKERDRVVRYYVHEISEEDFAAASMNFLAILRMVSQLNKLTPKQLELLKLAVSEGYYSWPKGVDSVELSKMLGVSRVSVVKSLRRAELKVLSSVVDFLSATKKEWVNSF